MKARSVNFTRGANPYMKLGVGKYDENFVLPEYPDDSMNGIEMELQVDTSSDDHDWTYVSVLAGQIYRYSWADFAVFNEWKALGMTDIWVSHQWIYDNVNKFRKLRHTTHNKSDRR